MKEVYAVKYKGQTYTVPKEAYKVLNTRLLTAYKEAETQAQKRRALDAYVRLNRPSLGHFAFRFRTKEDWAECTAIFMVMLPRALDLYKPPHCLGHYLGLWKKEALRKWRAENSQFPAPKQAEILPSPFEFYGIMDSALGALSGQEQEVIQRAFEYGETLQSIAEDWGCSAGMVKYIKNRGLRRLKPLFAGG